MIERVAKQLLGIILILTISHLLTVVAAPSKSSLKLKKIAKKLNWVNSNRPNLICKGYYQSLAIPYTVNPKASDQNKNYNLYADHSSYSITGNSTFKGNIKIIQPNRELAANNATIIRNPKTGKNSTVHLSGDVQLNEPGILVFANKATLENKLVTLENVLYRARPSTRTEDERTVIRDPKTGKVQAYRSYQLNARGQAKKVKQLAPHLYQLKDASYTTCPPTSDTWHLHASNIKLNFVSKKGTATNTLLFIKKVPILYLPYYSFPLNNWRQTGLLSPSYYYHGNDHTWHTSLPFYWNMAPNYDMTITPTAITRRGLLTSSLFRYLTKNNQGTVYATILPHDNLFQKTQNTAQQQYGDDASYHDRLERLQNASDNRMAFSWQDKTTINSHWRTAVNYNYVSDDNYEEDFDDQNLGGTYNQLQQQGDLFYSSTDWNIDTTLQNYQTLHPIDSNGYSNQYQKLPQISFSFQPRSSANGDLSFTVLGNYTYFNIEKNPDSSTQLVTGNRFYAKPTITWQLSRPYGYFSTQMKLWSDAYATTNRPQGYGPRNMTRTIPIFDAHSKLIFTRDMRLFGHGLSQTLEPEIYYLLVPYVNQDSVPLFDTSAQTFSYSQMFSDNRFSGDDRLGDANQITLGVNSRLLDASSGEQKALLGIAQTYYFRDRRVCAGYDCSTISAIDQQNSSPIAAQASYYLNPSWHFNSQVTWNPDNQNIGSQLSYLQYKPNNKQLFNVGYYSVKDNQISGIVPSLATTDNSTQELDQAIFSFYWQLNPRWSFLGSWNRNWTTVNITESDTTQQDRYDTYSYGFQYDSCCWGVRMVGYRQFTGYNDTYAPKHDTGVYVEFALKGLGNFGNSGDNLLQKNIRGYQDATFSQGVL